jgi:uncharacterized membrane protein
MRSAKEWPTYVGYFISFSFIGGAWMAHSNMTRFIQAADAALLRLPPDQARSPNAGHRGR